MIRKWFHEIRAFRIHVREAAAAAAAAAAAEPSIKRAIKANNNNDRAWPHDPFGDVTCDTVNHGKCPCASEIKLEWKRNRRWSQNHVVPIYLLVVLAALKSSLFILFARSDIVWAPHISHNTKMSFCCCRLFVGAVVGGGLSVSYADEMLEKRNPRTLNGRTHIQNNGIAGDAANM